MKIIYFGGSYNPSQEIRAELERVQGMLAETNAGMLVDCKFDKYQYIIRRQQLADRLRSKWRVIQGGNTSAASKEA